MVLKGAGWKSHRFPSQAFLVETRAGLYLWDTGYAEHFRAATAQGIYRLYPLVTPVVFDAHDSLRSQLHAHGVQPRDIQALVLSHFHADHVAGLRDFPEARLLCASSAWEAVRGATGLKAVRRGFLPGLMPPDIEARLEWIEASPRIDLPGELAPFKQGWDITGDGEFVVVSLPGHVAGHVGAFVQEAQGWTLIASDAAWMAENYQQMRGPSELTFVIQHQRAAYYATLHKLHALHQSGRVRICLSHDVGVAPVGATT